MSSASPLARWLNWKPPILAEVLDHEPPKPTEAAFEGFAGDPSGQSLKIEAASAVFNRRGVRIMRIDGGAVIGIWSDLDGPEIREALQVVEVTLPSLPGRGGNPATLPNAAGGGRSGVAGQAHRDGSVTGGTVDKSAVDHLVI